MTATLGVSEGTICFRDHDTHYRIAGDASSGTPLLVLHGGPGVPHDYLRPLERLAKPGRAIVFYDQTGCGRSSRPDTDDLWTLDLFADELASLRRELGLHRVHLLGHSWGGILALEHTLRAPDGLASVILADTTASMPLHAAEVSGLRRALPEKAQEILALHEAAGTTHEPAYEEAALAFYARHICRLDPWPDALLQAFGALNPRVYAAMWGSEVRITGNLRSWDVADRLREIQAPTLVLGGRHDAMTPNEQALLHERIPGSERVVFEASSHLPIYEEPEAFFAALEHFLRRVERRDARA